MRLSLFLLLFLVIGACIDPFQYKAKSVPKYIIINGRITDQPGPYKVEITTSVPLDRSLAAQPISGASVTIADSAGVSEQLIESSAGVYLTSTLQGTIGHRYKLTVTLYDGSVYESTSETMLPVGTFTNLRTEFIYKVPVDDQSFNTNGFNIYADASFVPEQQGRAIWRWSGVHQFTTHPEAEGYLIGTKTFVPTPEQCSGYVYDYYTGNILKVATCTCCTCYHTIFNESPLISDSRMISNGMIKNQYLGFIPTSAYYFERKIKLTVTQESTSQHVFDFWTNVLSANAGGTSLFQSPPRASTGNVTAKTENADGVVGLFSAVSIRTDTITIFRSQIPYDILTIPTFKKSCLDVYSHNVTNIKPADY